MCPVRVALLFLPFLLPAISVFLPLPAPPSPFCSARGMVAATSPDCPSPKLHPAPAKQAGVLARVLTIVCCSYLVFCLVCLLLSRTKGFNDVLFIAIMTPDGTDVSHATLVTCISLRKACIPLMSGVLLGCRACWQGEAGVLLQAVHRARLPGPSRQQRARDAAL